MEGKRIWYAVQQNENDDDFGYGSYCLYEAVEMALEKELGECGIIAIVDVTSGYNRGERIGIYTMDKINRMHESRKERIEHLKKKFDDEEKKYKDDAFLLWMTRRQRNTLSVKNERSEYHTYRVDYSIYEEGPWVDHPVYGQVRTIGKWIENPAGEYTIKAEDRIEAEMYCEEYLCGKCRSPLIHKAYEID